MAFLTTFGIFDYFLAANPSKILSNTFARLSTTNISAVATEAEIIMTSAEDKTEAVNGKIDLGTRKLKAAYIENATTIYAYLDTEFPTLKEYTDKINDSYSNAEELAKGKKKSSNFKM